MTFQEKLRQHWKMDGPDDVLQYISFVVMGYNAFFHDKVSLILAILCASYLLATIVIAAVKTRQWPSNPGWLTVFVCVTILFSTLVSVTTAHPRT